MHSDDKEQVVAFIALLIEHAIKRLHLNLTCLMIRFESLISFLLLCLKIRIVIQKAG